MKVLAINLIIDKYLTVLTFRVTFFEGLIFIKNVLGRVSIHLMTHSLPQIYFENNYCWQAQRFERLQRDD